MPTSAKEAPPIMTPDEQAADNTRQFEELLADRGALILEPGACIAPADLARIAEREASGKAGQ